MTDGTTETLTINGQASEPVGQTIHELLLERGLDPARPGIAVAVNDSVIPRSRWATQRLQPADRIEIVHAQAGG